MFVEWQGKEARQLTPKRFADYLACELRRRSGATRIAALYASIYGPYGAMPDVEVWPLWAQCYHGPYPLIAHPPCGPWGKLKWRCKYQDASLGILAIEQAHRYGGVVEQPLGSTLFRDYGREGARIERLRQGDYGHVAEKWTLLYWTI